MSNINPNNIDGTYPVAGQDNDSQGFRDNFTNIRNNFTFAKSELEDIASKVILKQALVGGVLNNDMVGSPLVGATVSNFSELRKDFTTVSGSQVINYAEGHYQKLTTGNTVTLTFTNWPASGKNGRMRLEINVSDAAHVVNFASGVMEPVLAGAVLGLNGNQLTFESAGKYIYELESDDGGATLKIRDLYRANRTGTDVLVADAVISSASLEDVGLSFVAVPSARYVYSAVLPIDHSTTDTPSFSVAFSAGAGVATVEQQTSAASAFEVDTITASDTAVTASVGSTDTRMVRITGSFKNTSGSGVEVKLRASTVAGALTVLEGASLTYTRL